MENFYDSHIKHILIGVVASVIASYITLKYIAPEFTSNTAAINTISIKKDSSLGKKPSDTYQSGKKSGEGNNVTEDSLIKLKNFYNKSSFDTTDEDVVNGKSTGKNYSEIYYKSIIQLNTIKYPANEVTEENNYGAVINKVDNSKVKYLTKVIFRSPHFITQSSFPANDKAEIALSTNYSHYKKYGPNFGGIIFWTECKNCDWNVQIANKIYKSGIIKSEIDPDTIPLNSLLLLLKAKNNYNLTVVDKCGKKYGPFVLNIHQGETKICHIIKYN